MTTRSVDIFLALLSFLSHLLILTADGVPYINQTCFDGRGTYTDTSAYHTNLNTLVSNFTSNTKDDYGFYNYSYGEKPDTVYASGLCQGDLQPDVCRSCLNVAASLLLQRCPNQKEAFLYNDRCTFQYSSSSMYGIYLDPDFHYAINNPENVAEAEQYTDALDQLMQVLKSKAAAGGPHRKVAAGNASTPSAQNVFGLAQCTPDLTEQECDDCLVKAISDIPICCQNKVGGRVIKRNCNLRFEKVRFYDPTVLDPIQLSSSPPPPTTTGSSQGPPDSPDVPSSREGKNNRTRTIIIVAVVIGAFIALLILVFIYFAVRKSKKTIQNEAEIKDDEEIKPADSLQFDFETIRLATDNFSIANKLGQGGFGPVYKGKLRNGQVAVKRLSVDSGQGDLEFKNEVSLMAKLQHRNLVRLLGFCFEGTERLLIYEFLPNRSLDYILFDPIQRTHLHWEVRYQIIVGIARGILYLHEDSRLHIIHRDLKASNILLDKDFNSKIADFGMARLFVVDQTQSNTSKVVGTYGYMAPEYAMHGQISTKLDVFSFGILVLEIITGQKNSSVIDEESIQDLLSFVWKNWREGTTSNIVDPVISSGSRDEIMRCIHIALLCVQENAEDRPTMASVELMLNSYTSSLPLPSRPPCLMNFSSTLEMQTREENEGDE